MNGIAIHGFGRIGRTLLRAALKNDLFVPVSISDVTDPATLAALFEVDSNYGRWHEGVDYKGGSFKIGDRSVRYFDTCGQLPGWGAEGIDLVIDCTGRATTRPAAQAHLDRGAKYVLVSAASKTEKDADAFLLPGINLDSFEPQRHRIVSMASCTTNALAPVIKILLETCGIERGTFTTVHAYTNTQALTDQPMKERRDSWAAAESIIPSSSNAQRALKFIWRDLNITGRAYRVPVRTGSIVEVNLLATRATTEEELKEAFRRAGGRPPLKGVMDVLEGEWASSRIVSDEHSSIVDIPLITVLDSRFVSVAAWYDNEMGYATRLAEVAAYIHANA